MPNKSTAVAVLLIVLLSLLSLYQQDQLVLLRREDENREQAFAALHSQISKRVSDGIAEYKKNAPEIGAHDLVNSPEFKTLTHDQQAFYKGLRAKGAGLVSAVRVVTIKRDTVHAEAHVTETQSASAAEVCFVRGDVAQFADTSRAFKWSANVTFDSPAKLDLRYTYKPTFTTTFERDRNTHATVVKFSVNDPDMQVQDIQSIVVPAEERDRTRVGKWLYDRRAVLRAVGAGVIFSAGVAGGVMVAR